MARVEIGKFGSFEEACEALADWVELRRQAGEVIHDRCLQVLVGRTERGTVYISLYEPDAPPPKGPSRGPDDPLPLP